MPDNFAYTGLKIIIFMGYQRFDCVYFLRVFILVYILVFLVSFSKRLVYLLQSTGNDVVRVYIRVKYLLALKKYQMA